MNRIVFLEPSNEEIKQWILKILEKEEECVEEKDEKGNAHLVLSCTPQEYGALLKAKANEETQEITFAVFMKKKGVLIPWTHKRVIM